MNELLRELASRVASLIGGEAASMLQEAADCAKTPALEERVLSLCMYGLLYSGDGAGGVREARSEVLDIVAVRLRCDWGALTIPFSEAWRWMSEDLDEELGLLPSPQDRLRVTAFWLRACEHLVVRDFDLVGKHLWRSRFQLDIVEALCDPRVEAGMRRDWIRLSESIWVRYLSRDGIENALGSEYYMWLRAFASRVSERLPRSGHDGLSGVLLELLESMVSTGSVFPIVCAVRATEGLAREARLELLADWQARLARAWEGTGLMKLLEESRRS